MPVDTPQARIAALRDILIAAGRSLSLYLADRSDVPAGGAARERRAR